MGLKIDRCDSRCALCREAEADKTGSHLAPNFMIHGMFSFDGKGRRNREISMRDHLNTSERMVYYGPEVSPDAINADHGGDLTDEELEEFRSIINEKLSLARRDYDIMMKQLMNADGNDVDDTSPTYKVLEEGSATQTKEELMTQAARLQKFIQGLEAALVRIQNKTYGIDRITGELIPKERLRAVPHATLSVQSKMNGKH